jgi:hypothetical protein
VIFVKCRGADVGSHIVVTFEMADLAEPISYFIDGGTLADTLPPIARAAGQQVRLLVTHPQSLHWED